jgi:hypothetical protein
MRCVICHSDIVPPEILAMCTRCRKSLIAYHKFNGITTMKKHVKSHHFSLLKKLLEYGANFAIRFSLNYEWVIKRRHMYFLLLYLVSFSIASKFLKDGFFVGSHVVCGERIITYDNG